MMELFRNHYDKLFLVAWAIFMIWYHGRPNTEERP